MNTHNSLKAAAKELKDAWDMDMNNGPDWYNETEQAEFYTRNPNLCGVILEIMEFAETEEKEDV